MTLELSVAEPCGQPCQSAAAQAYIYIYISNALRAVPATVPAFLVQFWCHLGPFWFHRAASWGRRPLGLEKVQFRDDFPAKVSSPRTPFPSKVRGFPQPSDILWGILWKSCGRAQSRAKMDGNGALWGGQNMQSAHASACFVEVLLCRKKRLQDATGRRFSAILASFRRPWDNLDTILHEVGAKRNRL